MERLKQEDARLARETRQREEERRLRDEEHRQKEEWEGRVRKEAAVLQMVSDNQKIARLKKSEKLKSLMADDPKLPRCDYCENRGYVRVAPNLDPRVASALARDHNFSGSSGQTNAKYQDEHGNPVNPANVCAACSQCERGKRWKAEYGNFFTCPR